MKQLYLCNSCRKMGIRSSKARMFEDFYCPKCKKNTTLFLPTVKIEKPKEEPVIQEAANTPVVLEPVVTSRGLFDLKDGIIFIIGFISALLIMKT